MVSKKIMLTEEQKRNLSSSRTCGTILLLALALLFATHLPAESSPRFDGARAYEHVRHLVEIGPTAAGIGWNSPRASLHHWPTEELRMPR